MPIQYRIVSATTLHDLETKVNEALREASVDGKSIWQLFGGIVTRKGNWVQVLTGNFPDELGAITLRD